MTNSEDPREEIKKKCAEAKKEKLPKWEKIIRESFSKDNAEKEIARIIEGLDSGSEIIIEKTEKLVSLLELAKTGESAEILKQYKNAFKGLQDRMSFLSCLAYSKYGEKFLYGIIEDSMELFEDPQKAQEYVTELIKRGKQSDQLEEGKMNSNLFNKGSEKGKGEKGKAKD